MTQKLHGSICSRKAASTGLRVSNGNVTGIVDRLTEEGLALRVAVPGDRRAQLARLTPKGQNAIAALAGEHEAWIDARLGALSAEDARGLSQVLDTILSPGEDHDSA